MSNVRKSHLRRSIKKVFLNVSQNPQENTFARLSFLVKLQASTCNFIEKGTLAQAFSDELCEILKNTFFTEHFRKTVSVMSQVITRNLTSWVVLKVES